MSRTGLRCLFFLLFAFGADAQESAPPVPGVADAIAARDSGNLADAAAILRGVLEREPANGEAKRHLAQLLYWLKDVPGATALYERAMEEYPEDFTLRLDYGRMLVETGSDARALAVLTPLTSIPEAAPRAIALLGTFQYWRGDLIGASRSFRIALAGDPSLDEARRQLDEIRTGAAPWLTIAASGLRDDQPVDRVSAHAELGFFVTPLTSLSARATGSRFGYDDSRVPCEGASRGLTGARCNTTAFIADALLHHTFAAARIDARIGAGFVARSFGSPSYDWVGHGAVRFRPVPVIAVQATTERAPYFATETSVYIPVMTNTGTAAIALDHPAGWLGEAAFRLEEYDDSNRVRTVYAWALAPLLRNEQLRMSAGYSIASQDAEESRFDIYYRPYYTPENILSHSTIGRLELSPSRRTSFSIHGSYGFSAREDAPTQIPGLGGGLRFDRRDFNPWEAHARLVTSMTVSTSLSVTVDAMKTAFYRATTARVSLTHRFLPRPSL